MTALNSQYMDKNLTESDLSSYLRVKNLVKWVNSMMSSDAYMRQ